MYAPGWNAEKLGSPEQWPLEGARCGYCSMLDMEHAQPNWGWCTALDEWAECNDKCAEECGYFREGRYEW